MEEPTVISRYTRAEAIGDGTLIDISQATRENGILIPSAMTAAAYEECVAWTDDDSEARPGEGQTGGRTPARRRLDDAAGAAGGIPAGEGTAGGRGAVRRPARAAGRNEGPGQGRAAGGARRRRRR